MRLYFGLLVLLGPKIFNLIGPISWNLVDQGPQSMVQLTRKKSLQILVHNHIKYAIYLLFIVFLHKTFTGLKTKLQVQNYW